MFLVAVYQTSVMISLALFSIIFSMDRMDVLSPEIFPIKVLSWALSRTRGWKQKKSHFLSNFLNHERFSAVDESSESIFMKCFPIEKDGYGNKRSQKKVSQDESLQRQINNLKLRAKNTTSNCDAKKNMYIQKYKFTISRGSRSGAGSLLVPAKQTLI